MNTQLFIPKKLKVGFNKRVDTYTGKLGYVIGWDGKKWRKEPSWEGWREKYQEPVAFEAEKRKQYEQNIKQIEGWFADYKKRGTQSPTYVKNQEEALEKLKTEDGYKNFKPNTYSTKWSNDKSIESVEYDNIPTSGFVLNRKAGGDCYGWNPRQTYCRVWDPRGFEFEITIPNLLFILQETTSTKGKGLEGEFVYSWDGKDLVLLPCECEEYKKSAKFTKLQSNKVGTKELTEGCSYKTKKEENLIYLGKLNWYELITKKRTKKEKGVAGWRLGKEMRMEKVFLFYNEKTKQFFSYSKVDFLAEKNSDIVVSEYAAIMEKYSEQKEATAPFIVETPATINFDEEKWLEWNKNDKLGYPQELNKSLGFFYKKITDGKYLQYSLSVETKDKSIYDKNILGIPTPGAKYLGYKNLYDSIRVSPIRVVGFKDGKLTVSNEEEVSDRSPLFYNKEKVQNLGLLKLRITNNKGHIFNIE